MVNELSSLFQISWGHIEDVELVNDGSGLGFGIVGGKSIGVVVRTIVPGGLADKVTCYTMWFFSLNCITIFWKFYSR